MKRVVVAMVFSIAPLIVVAELVGVPVVSDGNTLELDGRLIRLADVDVPALEQTCFAPEQWSCGEQAAEALERLIDSRPVRCRGNAEQSQAAVCQVEDVELNRWLVAQGWALAAEEAPRRYLERQELAAGAGKGVWRGGFEPNVLWHAWAAERLDPADFAACSPCSARKQRLKDKNPE